MPSERAPNPAEPIETERLILRQPRVEDFEESFALWSDPEVVRYIGGVPSSREVVWGRLLRYAGQWALFGFGFWMVRDKRSGAFVGEVGFHNLRRDISPPLGDRPELGWALMPNMQGKGLASEAVAAAIAWGEALWGAREIVCIIEPGNEASLRIAKKFGFSAESRATYKGVSLLLMTRGGN